MPLPLSILTPDVAGPLVEKAALLSSLPRSAWDEALPESQQAALDAAWLAIAGQPSYNLVDATGESAVQSAVVVEALARLTMANDAGANARSSLVAQGVQSVSVGSVSESYGRRPALHPATRALLQPYSGAVSLA